MRTLLLLVLLLVPLALHAQPADTTSVPLLDGRSLDGWQVTPFGPQGEVRVDSGAIILGYGDPMTGITYTGDFPRNDYEVTWQAQRRDGNDFFSTVTFPVDSSYVSWVIGGWGGGVVGISSIDGADASENETTRYRPFEDGRWYDMRLRVAGGKIQAWIDNEQWVDVATEGRDLSIRVEVALSRPFGFSTYRTTGVIRNVQLRRVAP